LANVSLNWYAFIFSHKDARTQRITKKKDKCNTICHEGLHRKFLPLSPEEEEIGRAVVNAAYVVHKALGPGLLEKVYEVCFCHVLAREGYLVKRQIDIPIVFDMINFNVPLIKDGIKRMVR